MENPRIARSTTTPAMTAETRRRNRDQNDRAGRTLSESTASFGAAAGNATSNAVSGNSENPMTNSVPMSE